MKILFLDHQSVMRLDPVCWLTDKPKLQDFDITAIEIINNIILETDCEIVVSSDWKLWVDLSEMQDFYLRQGMLKSPIGYTPDRSTEIQSVDNIGNIRMLEIKEWLYNNKNVSKWVVIDDLDMRDLERFVFIDPTMGLTEESLDKVKNLLL